MVRIGVLVILVGLGLMPGLARAQEPKDQGDAATTPLERAQEESAHVGKPRTRFALPDGKLNTTSTRLAAAGQTVRVSVDLDRPVSAARLALRLPARWVERAQSGLPFARVPGSRDLAGARARLRRDGRTLAVHFRRARASDTATISIQDVGIPAGTYKLPYTWRDRAGKVLASGEVSIVFYAPVREGAPPNPLSRMADLRNNATGDAAEESEAFDAVTPGNPNRVAVGINYNEPPFPFDAWISGDGGQTWTQRTMPATMDQPGSATDQASEMCCDPTFAADDLGNIWYGGLSFSDTRPATDSRIVVNRIAAGSTNFQTKSTGLPVNTDAEQDKPMMTVDNSPTSPTYGRLYVVWDEPGASGGINLVLSQCDTFPNGGARDASRCDDSDHWSTPVSVTASEGSYIYGDVAVDSGGRVHGTGGEYFSTHPVMGEPRPRPASGAHRTSAAGGGRAAPA